MKVLKERTKIARTINFHKMPVVTLDLAKKSEYGIQSEPVLIDAGFFKTGEPFYIYSSLEAYSDEKSFKFKQGATCLKASFGYSDIEEMLKYRNAPIVEVDQDFLLVVIDSKKRIACYPVVLHTGNRIDKFCSTPLTVVATDCDATEYLKLAGFEV